VKSVTGQLRTAGHVTRGFLGVETQPVTEGIAPGLGLGKDAHGALVAAVAPGSPAAKAGLLPGDVLTAVDGAVVRTPKELAQRVADVKPGQSSDLTLMRDGAAKTLTVKIGTMEDEQQTADASATSKREGGIGLALAPLSDELRDQLDIPAGQRGALVAGVAPGSAAEQAGLRQGDLVVGVGAKPVTSPSEAATAIRSATRDGKSVALRIMREGQARFVPVSPNAQG
jgi:serine protease Do